MALFHTANSCRSSVLQVLSFRPRLLIGLRGLGSGLSPQSNPSSLKGNLSPSSSQEEKGKGSAGAGISAQRFSTITELLRPGDFSDEATKWKQAEAHSFLKIPGLYQELSKAKLSALVVLTAMSGYALAPGVVDVKTLLWTTVGTALCSASANSINQWLEVPFDAQMARTRNRVLVRGALQPFQALLFGLGAGLTGVTALAVNVNPLTAGLGLLNIFLYTSVYTPLKRVSIINTWIGSIVGAIPPLMGWAACTGSIDHRAAILAGILYAWQFPHFNALSWNLRADYSKAGYRMMVVTEPALNARVALRYSAAMIPLCLALPYFGVTTWWFALDSNLINIFMTFRSWRFYQDSNQQSARDLFFASLMHLPLVMILMILHKKSATAEDEEEQEKGDNGSVNEILADS